MIAVQHLAALQGVGMEAGGRHLAAEERSAALKGTVYFPCKFCLLRISVVVCTFASARILACVAL